MRSWWPIYWYYASSSCLILWFCSWLEATICMYKMFRSLEIFCDFKIFLFILFSVSVPFEWIIHIKCSHLFRGSFYFCLNLLKIFLYHIVLSITHHLVLYEAGVTTMSSTFSDNIIPLPFLCVLYITFYLYISCASLCLYKEMHLSIIWSEIYLSDVSKKMIYFKV